MKTKIDEIERATEARIKARGEADFVGVALARLASARARGWDWTLFTSWCSGPEAHDVFILRLREPGGEAHAAKTKVGALADVLRWGVERVGQDVTVDPRAPAG